MWKLIFFVLVLSALSAECLPTFLEVKNITGTFETFGEVVAMDRQGDHWAVASWKKDDGIFIKLEGVYPIKRYGNATWVVQPRINSPFSGLNRFGATIKIAGNYMFVGAPDVAPGAGRVSVYSLGLDGVTWTFSQSLDVVAEASFGALMDVSANNWLIVAGTSKFVYIYRLVGTTWTLFQSNAGFTGAGQNTEIKIHEGALQYTVIDSSVQRTLTYGRTLLTGTFVFVGVEQFLAHRFGLAVYSGQERLVGSTAYDHVDRFNVPNALTATPAQVVLPVTAGVPFGVIIGTSRDSNTALIASSGLVSVYNRTGPFSNYDYNGKLFKSPSVSSANFAYSGGNPALVPTIQQRLDIQTNWIIVGAPSPSTGGTVSFYYINGAGMV